MMQEVMLKLPDATLKALRQNARDEDVSIGTLVRDAIERDLRRREQAKTPVRADERLVAPLRALLAGDFAFAASWDDLLARMRAKGYALAEAGGGLVLTDLAGQRLCKGSELGYGYSALLRKFDAPFPGHRHDWLLARLRGQDSPGKRGPDLIED